MFLFFVFTLVNIKKRKIKEKKVLTSLPNRDTMTSYRKDEQDAQSKTNSRSCPICRHRLHNQRPRPR